MKFHVYGYKRTEDGDKSVYQGTTDNFVKAVQAAKQVYANGAKCNVVYQGKTIIKF